MFRWISESAQALTFTELTLLVFTVTSATASGVVVGFGVDNAVDRVVYNYQLTIERLQEHPAPVRRQINTLDQNQGFRSSLLKNATGT